MKKPHLPVSLVMIETICHDLAKLAVEDTLRHADFDEVLIFSDRDLGIPGARYIPFEHKGGKDSLTEFLWYWLPGYINTSHALLLHWDSWIIDPEMYRPEVLDYDYVGAPWWFADGMNVGCGAFCLRSKRLMQYLAMHRDEFPNFAGDDRAICREYRPALEAAGFRWPSEELAFSWAFELTRPLPSSRHFGFHKMVNWPLVLPPRELFERAKLVIQQPYLIRTAQLTELLTVAPWLGMMLVQEAGAVRCQIR